MKRLLPALSVSILWLTFAPSAAGPSDLSVCTALLADQRAQAADYELEVELGRSRLAAFEKIFKLIDGLMEGEAIERMIWLEARHDRDAARVELERAQLILVRQGHHVEQIRLGCAASGDDRAGKIREARRRYRQADCDQQAKAVEIAKIDLEFSQTWLASILDLREGRIGTATAQDVIRAELDVTLEEQRLADATARTDACRKDLAAKP